MNTGTYSVFATTFGLKMYYIIKDRKWLDSSVPIREAANKPQSIKNNLISNSDQLELQIVPNTISIIE
jgi:hypothetical protein